MTVRMCMQKKPWVCHILDAQTHAQEYAILEASAAAAATATAALGQSKVSNTWSYIKHFPGEATCLAQKDRTSPADNGLLL